MGTNFNQRLKGQLDGQGLGGAGAAGAATGEKGDELTLKMDQSVPLFYQYQVFNRILDGGALMLLTSRWSTTFQSNFAVL